MVNAPEIRSKLYRQNRIYGTEQKKKQHKQ